MGGGGVGGVGVRLGWDASTNKGILVWFQTAYAFASIFL